MSITWAPFFVGSTRGSQPPRSLSPIMFPRPWHAHCINQPPGSRKNKFKGMWNPLPITSPFPSLDSTKNESWSAAEKVSSGSGLQFTPTASHPQRSLIPAKWNLQSERLRMMKTPTHQKFKVKNIPVAKEEFYEIWEVGKVPRIYIENNFQIVLTSSQHQTFKYFYVLSPHFLSCLLSI